jgi:energy-coupling factor transporter transmembrane protein EcfT
VIGVGTVDRSATSDLGWLHRLSPLVKLAAFGVALAAVIVNWNALIVLALALVLVGVASGARIDLKSTFMLASYPALFALIFAWASAPNAVSGATIVLKAMCAGLLAVILVMTTPYPQIFAPIQSVVPPIVGDALLMTYRTTFLLLDKFASLLRAVRLRAGLRGKHPAKTARITTQALGGLLLYSFDLAQRDYDILRLRGYSGRLRVNRLASRDRVGDALLLAGTLALLATSIVFRVDAAALNPYSWMVLIPALASVAAGLIARWRTP